MRRRCAIPWCIAGRTAAGVWVSPTRGIGLGHRRLSIIDLSDRQPAHGRRGRLGLARPSTARSTITLHLRQELEAAGHRFRTDHSDTEVIVHGFEEWGIDCVERFRGMFAFALWDGREDALWLARDRIGVKPLYLPIRRQVRLFASEIKALLADPAVPRGSTTKAMLHYLSFLTTPAPDTLFKGIHKLPAAAGCASRRTEAGGASAIGTRSQTPRMSARRATTRSLRACSPSCAPPSRCATISDVPVGVFLSGGIDSSTNAALFAEGVETVRTFSIGYDRDYGTYTNELDYAAQVAKQIGAEHHELRLTIDDLISFLPRMVELQDEPIADPVCVPIYYVSQARPPVGRHRLPGRRGRR